MRTTRSLSRLTVVLAVFLAWFLAGNHCALLAATAPPPEHTCCAKKEPIHSQCQDCCVAMKAAVPSLAAAAGPLDLFVAVDWPESFFLDVPTSLPTDSLCGLSPPGSLSFARIVLGTCLSALAPPVS